MLSDLINLTDPPTTNDDAPPATALSRFARRMLVAMSVIIGLGLAGVVFARSTPASEPRLSIVWVLRGQPVIMTQPVDPRPSETQPQQAVESTRESEPEPQLATAQIEREQAEVAVTATPQAAATALPAGRRIVMMEVTAYCPCTKCCGPQAQGITASGKDVSYNSGKFIAADRKFAFGTRMIIPGYGDGQPVEVIDRGGAIKGDKLDVYFPTHQEALEWGRQKLPVIVEG